MIILNKNFFWSELKFKHQKQLCMSKVEKLNNAKALIGFKKWMHSIKVSYRMFTDPFVWNKIFLFYEDDIIANLEQTKYD